MNQTVTLSTYGMELLSSDRQIVNLSDVMDVLTAEASADGETEATIEDGTIWYPDYTSAPRPMLIGIINRS